MNEKKRKQKQYYAYQAKKAKLEKRKLHPGLRGFLCTTNNKERECVREAYNLLNEYANDMYGPEHGKDESGNAGHNVEESLEAELAALKQEKVSKERRFQQVDSGAKNCIFISTRLERTAPLVERIAREIYQSGSQRTRYLLRLLPVQVTCKATEEDIRASAESMIKEAFTEVGITYTTVFKSRNQAQLTQTDAQEAINGLIDAVCPTARLDHKTPRLTVVMEVIRNVICLGVLRDYAQMRKYNLVELAKGSAPEGGGNAGGASGDGEKSGGNGAQGKESSGSEEGEANVEGSEGKASAEGRKEEVVEEAETSRAGGQAVVGEGGGSSDSVAVCDAEGSEDSLQKDVAVGPVAPVSDESDAAAAPESSPDGGGPAPAAAEPGQATAGAP